MTEGHREIAATFTLTKKFTGRKVCSAVHQSVVNKGPPFNPPGSLNIERVNFE